MEASAATSDDRTAYLRRVGRYVLWCLDNGHDPAESNRDRVKTYLSAVRTLEGQRPFAPRTAEAVKGCIAHWHVWLQP